MSNLFKRTVIFLVFAFALTFSPLGFASAAETIEVSITEIKDVTNGISVTVQIRNNTDHNFSFGWAGGSDLILKTDVDAYSVGISSTANKISIGKSEFTFTLKNAEGIPDEIRIRGIMPLDSNGLPTGSFKNGEYIYDSLDDFVFTSSEVPQITINASHGSSFGNDILTDYEQAMQENEQKRQESERKRQEIERDIESTRDTINTVRLIMSVIFPLLFVFMISFNIYIIVLRNRLKKSCGDVISDANDTTVRSLLEAIQRSKLLFSLPSPAESVYTIIDLRNLLNNAYDQAVISHEVTPGLKEDLRVAIMQKGVLAQNRRQRAGYSRYANTGAEVSQNPDDMFGLDDSYTKELSRAKLEEELSKAEGAAFPDQAVMSCGNFLELFFATLLKEYWSECYDDNVAGEFGSFLAQNPDVETKREHKMRKAVFTIWNKIQDIRRGKGEPAFPAEGRSELYSLWKIRHHGAHTDTPPATPEEAQWGISVVKRYFSILYP
jgi:hypothetical protein